MKRLKKRLPALLIALVLSVSLAAPAFAADVSYAFNLRNSGQTYNVYTSASNTKAYADNAATVKVSSMPSSYGYGFAFHMSYKSGISYYSATVSSPNYWLGGVGTIHPNYATNQNIEGRAYYVSARVDDDSPTGTTYSCSGMFNSDYT